MKLCQNNYRVSSHNAFFGGKKRPRYAKSRYASPILVLKCKLGGKTFLKSTFWDLFSTQRSTKMHQRTSLNNTIHSLSFIRNAYKEQFSWLVKSFEKIRNRLVIFLKINLKTLVKNMFFPQKIVHFRINFGC